jgi:3-oxoacyl-[acyl-carrier protein] reductase
MMAGKIQTHWDITESLSDEAWSRMLAVHLNGTFYCTRAALKLMRRLNRGAIVNISSVAGLGGIPIAPHCGARPASWHRSTSFGAFQADNATGPL